MTGSNQELKRCSSVEARRSSQGAVLVDMNSGRCFRLNGVGADIWALLESPVDPETVCGHIAMRYGKTVEQIEGDVRALLDLLIREKLVERTSAPGPRS